MDDISLFVGDTKQPRTPLTQERVRVLIKPDSDLRVPKFLIASPYASQRHLLDLIDLGPIARYLAVALVDLQPPNPTYALRPFPLAFNWEEIFAQRLSALLTSKVSDIDKIWPIGETQLFFVVIFRSTLQEDIDKDLLSQLDKESHAEAMGSGGLLKYWFGNPDEEKRNLATCIWRSKKEAVEGGKGPWHRRARQAASQLYKEIQFEKLWLQLRRGESGIDWSFVAANDYDSDSSDTH